MRRVKINYFFSEANKSMPGGEGFFHGFTTDTRGGLPYLAAIVERYDGSIRVVSAKEIQFILPEQEVIE